MVGGRGGMSAPGRLEYFHRTTRMLFSGERNKETTYIGHRSRTRPAFQAKSLTRSSGGRQQRSIESSVILSPPRLVPEIREKLKLRDVTPLRVLVDGVQYFLSVQGHGIVAARQLRLELCLLILHRPREQW